MRLAALVVALVLTGCTSSTAPTTPASPAGAGAAASSSPVAELQAGLTALLVERAYVVAVVTESVAGADGRREDPAVTAAAEALDGNSTALSDVLGATYRKARAPLLQALRRDDRLLLQHAVALATGDARGAATARGQLVEAQGDLARVVRRVVPTLDAPEVAERLGGDVQAQLPPRSYARLRAAATTAAGTARLLAAGIAADRGLGSAGTDAVRLRSDLTGLLTEHVALVAALARELRTPGPGAAGAQAALQANADALADVLGETYPAARTPFLRSWTAHNARLQRYATSRARGGSGSAEAGLVRNYPAELARLLEQHVVGLPAQSSRTELEPALGALLAVVDAAGSGAADGPTLLREATAAVLPAAALVSAAVAEHLRLS